MAKLTPAQLNNIKYKLSENVGGRGDGALLFEKRSSGMIEAYYRYRARVYLAHTVYVGCWR